MATSTDIEKFAQAAINLGKGSPVRLGSKGQLVSQYVNWHLYQIGKKMAPRATEKQQYAAAADVFDNHRREVNARMKQLLQEVS